MAEEISDAQFGEIIQTSEVPVFVDFFAPWCGPCRAMGPILDELSKEYEGKIRICKMNVDNNPVTPQKYGVRAIPTMVLIKNGQTVEQMTGAVSKEFLTELFNKKALA